MDFQMLRITVRKGARPRYNVSRPRMGGPSGESEESSSEFEDTGLDYQEMENFSTALIEVRIL